MKTSGSFLVVVMLAVAVRADARPRKNTVRRPAAAAAAKKMDALPDDSVYNVTSQWVTQDGDKVKLESFAGKPVLLAMVYTSCQYACPMIVADLRKIQNGLGERADDVRFVLVTIDPARDTPEKLKAFRDERKLKPGLWTLLHGGESDIRELAAVLGFSYRKVSETEYAHSNLITLLSPDGRIVHKQEGLDIDPAETLAAIRLYLKPEDSGAETPVAVTPDGTTRVPAR